MKTKRLLATLLTPIIVLASIPVSVSFANEDKDDVLSAMRARAEAIVNYEWTPSQRIDVWNENPYNGNMYFEAGETVVGMPYSLFYNEFGVDSLLSLEQYKRVSSSNYSATAFCISVNETRTGPVYGSCCATFVSEVFGGVYMNGANPRYDNVGGIQKCSGGITFYNATIDQIQPGDALSNTSGGHIIWVGDVSDDEITIYEQTPPVAIKRVISKSSITSEGYLIARYKENGSPDIYNVVTRTNELFDFGDEQYTVDSNYPTPITTKKIPLGKTLVYTAVNGNQKYNKIYEDDECVINRVFDNGWCHVTFPLDAGGYDVGYVETSTFFDTSYEPTVITLDERKTTYKRNDLSDYYGYSAQGDRVIVVGETESAMQIIYPLLAGGYKMGWISKGAEPVVEVSSEWETPIKACTIATGKTLVYTDFNGTAKSNKIYDTDVCTIETIYNNGWCYVSFPLDAGGSDSGYVETSTFFNPNSESFSATVNRSQQVYARSDYSNIEMFSDYSVYENDEVLVISETSNAAQILFDYNGESVIGWIPIDALLQVQEPNEPENPEEPELPTLTSISVASNPTKTVYEIGESFDSTGLEIKLNYSNGTYSVIEDGYQLSGFSSSTAGTKTITVTYEDKITTFKVTVNEIETPSSNAKFTVENIKTRAGKTIELTVSIENNPGIISLRSLVTYDNSVLELKSVTNLGLLNGYTTPSSTISSPYTVRWADSLATNNNEANGAIMKLTFSINEDAQPGEYSVGIALKEARNANGQKVEFQSVQSNVTVIDYIVGDVDDDGEVGDWDAILLNRYLAGWDVEINELAADIDKDGEVGDWDAITLERFLAGWDIQID